MLRGLLSASADDRHSQPASRKEWRRWVEFATSIGQHPYLLGHQGTAKHVERVHVFLAFAAALRNGSANGGEPASAATVGRTLRFCGQVMESRGFADPRRAVPGSKELDPRVSRFLTRCDDKDPPPVRQQALPFEAIDHLRRVWEKSSKPSEQISQALIVTAYFFLLRVGEYTPRIKGRRTVPLRKSDIKLWRQGQPLDLDAPVDGADGVTICLENQKNGRRGDVLHHCKSGKLTCPVRAMSRLVRESAGMPSSTPIGIYKTAGGRYAQVRPAQIAEAVRYAAQLAGLSERGFAHERIGTHSLRAGGAVALKLAGYDETTIMKLGRWSSRTFLVYIRDQIGNLAEGVSTGMATSLAYHNVG